MELSVMYDGLIATLGDVGEASVESSVPNDL
jgi:hypothetical protein